MDCLFVFSIKMSAEAKSVEAAEQVTQEVKDMKLENGSAPGAANGTPTKSEDNGGMSLKVPT